MSDQIVHLKNVESLLQNLINSQKLTEGHLERLKSIEQLLERIAGAAERLEDSNQKTAMMMEKAWRSYDILAGSTKKIK